VHTLLFLAPAHFHAALTLRERHALVGDEIYVYAAPGPDLEAFLGIVESFNRRAERPAGWRVNVRTGDRPLDRLLAERAGDIAILAGRNDTKMAAIRRLHDAGLHVLADKPWLVGEEGLADLRATLGGGPIAMDIMTSRHEVSARLEQRLVNSPEVFGAFRTDRDEPAISMESVHCLYKVVNGAPLVRPPWFFDIRVQGDGIVDIPSHLVDRVQWWLEGAAHRDGREPELIAAERWPTPVTLPDFTRVTGKANFPAALGQDVRDGVLAYRGNGRMRYQLRGVIVELTTRWVAAAPAGGGDTHQARLRGTRAQVTVEQGPHTGFRPRLRVEPVPEASEVEKALGRAVDDWQDDFPGLAVAPVAAGFELRIPDVLRTGHETHFALVLDEFLHQVDRGSWPAARAADTLAKYTLLARASTLARQSEPPSLSARTAG
jgi:predicted dehydrogenase